MKSLDGKVALIVGAGRGIGAATAKLLASEGAQVTVADFRGELAESTAQAIRSSGGEAIHAIVDAASEEQIKAAVAATVKAFGKIDILHNNAAPTHLLPQDLAVADIDLAIWDETFNVIARGTYLACKHVIPIMKRNGGGSIINTSSMAGQRGTQIYHAYGAAKGAVDNLTRCIATAYGRDRIRCNAIAPGLILHVEPGEHHHLDPAFHQQWLDVMLVPRTGIDLDIARTVLFFAQDAADYITGQILAVDGGALAWGPWTRVNAGGVPAGST